MAARPGEILKPEDIQRIERLALAARGIVEGTLLGLHRSPAHGSSVEFAEYREYAPGDDLRYFDWKAFGRSDRHVIKKFHTETNTRCHLVVDSSRSMGYGRPAKLDYARSLAALLAYLLVKQQDAVGLLAIAEGIRDRLPPASGPGHLHALLAALARLEPVSSTRLAPALHDLAATLTRRGVLILLSDLYDDDEALLHALQHCRFHGHQVMVFHLVDPSEARFDFERVQDFVDLETGERLQVHGPSLRDAYRARFAAWLESLEARLGECGAEYVRVDTSEPFSLVLARTLHRRRRRRVAP